MSSPWQHGVSQLPKTWLCSERNVPEPPQWPSHPLKSLMKPSSPSLPRVFREEKVWLSLLRLRKRSRSCQVTGWWTHLRGTAHSMEPAGRLGSTHAKNTSTCLLSAPPGTSWWRLAAGAGAGGCWLNTRPSAATRPPLYQLLLYSPEKDGRDA